MEATGGNEDGLSGPGFHGVHNLVDRPFRERGFKLLARHPVPEAEIESGTGKGIGNVPHLRFRFATQTGSDFCGRMNLDGEVMAGIENLDEEGEPFALQSLAKDFLASLRPEIVQGESCHFPGGDHGLFIAAIRDFP